MTLLSAIAGAGILFFFVSPEEVVGGGGELSGGWFLTVIGAVIVGGLAGRWLLMQENVPFKESGLGSRGPVQFPPWFKWVTLGILVLMSLFVLFGSEILAVDDPENLEFSLGGMAFVVGIGGAIWLARRFDETEQRLRKQGRRGLHKPPN
ncbi:MAG: hypothetical protein R3C68_04360 [Myxococcota bacterium]